MFIPNADNNEEHIEMARIINVPLSLLVPATSMPAPPAVTKLQELPFEQLEWKNFERLCLRLASEESDIEECRLYGIQGDAQEGIDLYARVRGGHRYRTYQCKRVMDFQPAKIVAAVDAFLDGEWSQRSQEFYLCVATTLARRGTDDTMRQQSERLADRGIQFLAWDAERLSVLLKRVPEVVDDFFGRPWTEGFCGVEAAAKLGERLDGARILQLRERLGRLYFNVFRRDDESFPFREPGAEPEQSLILPDLVTNEDVIVAAEGGQKPPPTPREIDSAAFAVGDDEEFFASDASHGVEVVEQRRECASYLAAQTSTVLVGDPGAGKSTLLRVIALDLLSCSSQVEAVARRWARHVPIWIPFARWTALLANDGTTAQTSLLGAVEEWLQLHDAADVFQLVKLALAEKQVLLLVDGIDEWQSAQDARNAMALLDVFSADRELPVIASCRPRAMDMIGLPADWRVARIAPLSRPQQESIATRTLRRESTANNAPLDDLLLLERTRAFLNAVGQRSELAEIARTPLLLGLFARLWHRDHRLPENRFAAYGKLVEMLVETHPTRRITAARIDVPRMAVEALRRALGALALAVVTDHPSGTILRSDAVRVLERYFSDEEAGQGATPKEARDATTELLEHAADRAGVLVAKSPHEIGFYHRAVLEYLAAEAIAAADPADQLALIRARARDPQWHEVIVALAALTPTRAHVTAMLTAIRDVRGDALDKILTMPLLGSIAFSTNACSPRVSREIATEILDEIEVGSCFPIRARLLEQAVRGLHSPAIGALIESRIRRWLPRRPTYRTQLYQTIAQWPQTRESEECLWRGLHDENLADARAAAMALFGLGNREALLDVAGRSSSARIRAIVLDAAVRSNQQLSTSDVHAVAGDAPREELAFATIRARVAAGEQTDSDLDTLLEFATFRPDLDYHWRKGADEILVSGWRGTRRLRDVALARLTNPETETRLDHEIARRVLVRGFLDDDEVAYALAKEFDTEYGPYDHEIWPLYAEFARGCAPITAAMDIWLASSRSTHREVQAHWAALTTRSPEARNLMISRLGAPWPSWAARALLEGWGMDAPQVAQALERTVRGSPRQACELAPYIPKIIADQRAARELLLELIPIAGHRLGFVVHGLGIIRNTEPDAEIVTRILDRHDDTIDAFRLVRSNLFEYFSDDSRVLELARRQIRIADEYADLVSVALAGQHRPELRSEILATVGVLPVRLRLILAERLRTAPANEVVTESLGGYPHEAHAAARTQGALIYHTRSATTEPDIAMLRSEITKTGILMDEARGAAFAALLRIRRIDVFQTATEASGEPIVLRPAWLRGFNGPFWKEVAANWSLLKATLGAALFTRLTGKDDGDQTTWDALAAVSDRSQDLLSDVLSFAEQCPVNRLGPNVLRLLARTSPKTASLRETLIACMSASEPWFGGAGNYENPALVATELLADVFAGESETLQAVASSLPATGTPPALPIVALAIGWPSSNELERLSVFLAEHATDLPNIALAALCAVKGSAERVAAVVSSYDDYSAALQPAARRVVTRLMLRRLRTDDDAFERAMDARKKHQGPNLVVLLRLLSAARGLSELRPSMEHLANQELDGRIAPTLVRDPFSGALVAGSDVLLDGLLGR